jgi:arginine decarboxylase
MNAILPSKIFLTRGSGLHREKLISFEIALRDAGINPFNLVRVSSIFPPGCELVSRGDGLKLLKPGQIVFLVMSENATDEAHRLISASIGMAVPVNGRSYGYLAEHDSYGQDEADAAATRRTSPSRCSRRSSAGNSMADGRKGRPIVCRERCP